MQEMGLIPAGLERSAAPERLGGRRARILQRADITLRPGRISRGGGLTPGQRQPASTTLKSAAGFRTPDGNYAVIDAGNGSVFVTRPDTGSSIGPAAVLPLY